MVCIPFVVSIGQLKHGCASIVYYKFKDINVLLITIKIIFGLFGLKRGWIAMVRSLLAMHQMHQSSGIMFAVVK